MRVVLIVGVLLFSTACGSKAALGEDCTEATQCAEGLSCIQYGGREIVGSDLTCVATRRVCSIPCGQDSDCASAGSGLICIDDCFNGSCLRGSRS